MFASWTRRFHHPDAAFRGALNLHANNDEPAAREYWAKELGLDPISGFTKTFIKPDGTGHRKATRIRGVLTEDGTGHRRFD